MPKLTIQNGDSNTASFFLGANSERIFEMPPESVSMLLNAKAIKAYDFVADYLGLYTTMSVGPGGKFTVTKLTGPSDVIQSRKDCYTWIPKGKAYMKSEKVSMHDLEIMMEQCPDVLLGRCWRKILGAGNKVRDLLATPQGRILWFKLLDWINLAIGNSLFDLVDYGGHPVIEQAMNTGSWKLGKQTSQQWIDFYDQMMNTGVIGHSTILDTADESQMRGKISRNEVDGEEFTGDVDDLFDRADTQLSSFELKHSLNSRTGRQVVRKVTPGIFRAVKKKILSLHDKIDEVFRFSITDENNVIQPQRGVLRYGGVLVIQDDATAKIANRTGSIIHRCVTTMVGNYGVAYDTPELNQFNGVGLRINQKLEAPHKGAFYMNTNLEIGTAIMDKDLIVNQSLILTKKAA